MGQTVFGGALSASITLCTLSGLLAGCGSDGGSNETGGLDASNGADVAISTADGSSGDDASVNDAASSGAAGGDGSSMSAPPDASDGAAPVDASMDAAVDAGPYCTPATFSTDCPILPCQTVAGCVQNACTYTTLTVCPAGPASGTFLSGGADVTLNGVTLHGNIGAFRPADGTVCVGTTCITGGITP